MRAIYCAIGCAFCCFMFLSCAPAMAQLVVPANASVDVDGGSLDLGSADLQLAGALALGAGQLSHAANIVIASGGNLDAGNGSLTLFGDWSNAGTFAAGTSSVNFVDGVSVAHASGSSTFPETLP